MPRSSARWMVAIDSASSRGAVELAHAHAAEAEGGDVEGGRSGTEGASGHHGLRIRPESSAVNQRAPRGRSQCDTDGEGTVRRGSYDPQVPTPVLATKLFPPTPRSGLVARPRLAEQLDSTLVRGHRLTLISAPAGFGKSTLLSDWAARRADADVAVAWLSLDEGDNTLSRFLAHLWAALSSVGLDLDAQALDALIAAPPSAAMTAVVERGRTRGAAATGQPLAARARRLPRDRGARGPRGHDLPSGPHARAAAPAVATRSDPPFPLSRLRSRGQLDRGARRGPPLRARRRRRSSSTEVMGLDLADRRRAGPRGAHRRLDRRPAARGPVPAWHRGARGSRRLHRGIHRQQPLRHRLPGRRGPGPPAAPRCATSCCVPSSSSDSPVPCATRSRDGRTAAAMLEDLDRANLFVVALDGAALLVPLPPPVRRRPARSPAGRAPEQVPALHRRASDWYAAHGLVADAVRHALAAERLRREPPT